MKWVLTEDRLSRKTGWQFGNCKPSDIIDPVPFRLRDNDGEVYFVGVLSWSELMNSPEYIAFEPLDGFGAAYGCTEIQYKQDGCWKTL